MHHGTNVGDHDRVFDDEDRERAKFVLEQVQDELDDSVSVESMFAPFAEIVMQVLYDRRIDEMLADIAEMNALPVCKTCGCVDDVPWHTVDFEADGERAYHAYESNK